jgi:hypothetical protein
MRDCARPCRSRPIAWALRLNLDHEVLPDWPDLSGQRDAAVVSDAVAHRFIRRNSGSGIALITCMIPHQNHGR